jgi:hypothetical protein
MQRRKCRQNVLSQWIPPAEITSIKAVISNDVVSLFCSQLGMKQFVSFMIKRLTINPNLVLDYRLTKVVTTHMT